MRAGAAQEICWRPPGRACPRLRTTGLSPGLRQWAPLKKITKLKKQALRALEVRSTSAERLLFVGSSDSLAHRDTYRQLGDDERKRKRQVQRILETSDIIQAVGRGSIGLNVRWMLAQGKRYTALHPSLQLNVGASDSREFSFNLKGYRSFSRGLWVLWWGGVCFNECDHAKNVLRLATTPFKILRA